MLKVNNKKTIRKLAASSFRANKLRNLFAVIAIILTTVLFTGLFTVAGSLLSSMEESTMRQVGSNFHGGFKYLTAEQYDKLKTHPDIKSISYSVVLGVAENEKLAKRPTEIRYANDEIEAAAMFSLPTTGRLPQNEDELATDTLVLERLGIPAELGQKVTLEYSVGGEKRTDSFTL
ncbi:MAG: ABC transporter permease, partial [Oscillospiraceae bacterium]